VTIPEIIDQFHELILEDSQISAKSIAEQLAISRERDGSIIHEDLDMGMLSAKWIPKCLNADKICQRCQSPEQNLIFFLRDPNDFLSWLVTMDETWLYHHDLETKQQWMEWRHSGWPGPKIIPSAKIGWKISHLDFLGSRWHPPHWLSSKWPNYQRGVLLISPGTIEGYFEGKTQRKVHQGGLVPARQCSGPPGTCNPKETGLAYLVCQYLDHQPYSNILSPTLF